MNGRNKKILNKIFNDVYFDTLKPQDSRELNSSEKKKINGMAYLVFLNLRDLLLRDNKEQALDLVNAFHNTFLFLDKGFSLRRFKEDLKRYQDKHKDNLLFDYLTMVEDIEKGDRNEQKG
jgi:hypothetical protein